MRVWYIVEAWAALGGCDEVLVWLKYKFFSAEAVRSTLSTSTIYGWVGFYPERRWRVGRISSRVVSLYFSDSPFDTEENKFSSFLKKPRTSKVKKTHPYSEEKNFLTFSRGKKHPISPQRKNSSNFLWKKHLVSSRRKNTSFYPGKKTSWKFEGKNHLGC